MKTPLLFAILFSIGIAVLAGFYIVTSNKKVTEQKRLSTRVTPPQSAFATLAYRRTIPLPSTVAYKVQEVIKHGEPLDTQGNKDIARTNRYGIMYAPGSKSFVISILASPFEEVRNEAEAAFLQNTGLTKEEACMVNVSIGVPHFVSPERAGQVFPLSFCPTPPGP